MEEFIDIAAAGDLPVGRTKSFLIGERKIALYHTSSGYFASDNTCPHRGGPLAEGDLIGDEIICPWHLWGFDVNNGICTGDPGVSIAMHEVRVAGGRLLVKLSPPRVLVEEPYL